jgi:hypothetical protein
MVFCKLMVLAFGNTNTFGWGGGGGRKAMIELKRQTKYMR